MIGPETKQANAVKGPLGGLLSHAGFRRRLHLPLRKLPARDGQRVLNWRADSRRRGPTDRKGTSTTLGGVTAGGRCKTHRICSECEICLSLTARPPGYQYGLSAKGRRIMAARPD